jgi:hypothetical protein
MPDRDMKTICDLIYYQYAKIIARRAFGETEGKEAKKSTILKAKDILSRIKKE